MRKAMLCWACGIALLASARAGLAQPAAWSPERNVEIVVPVAQGGGTDGTARILRDVFDRLRLVAGSSVVNKPGGGGAEAWTYLQRQAGSGLYLAITTPQLLTNRITGVDSLTYTDFTPITNLYNEYVLVAVRADSPLRTGRDLSARFAQVSPPVSIGVAPSLGSHNHIAAALVARKSGGDPGRLRIEVFKTGPEAAAAAIDGRVDIVSATVGTLLNLVQAGKLRPLAVSAPKRLGGPLAAVPTWKEQGMDVVLPSWRGVVGPRGMSPAQIAYWEDVFLRLSFSDQWLEELRKQWWEGTYLNSAETRQFLADQYEMLKGSLTELGMAAP